MEFESGKADGIEKQSTFETNQARMAEIQQQMAALFAEQNQLQAQNENTMDTDRKEGEAMDVSFDTEKSRAEAEAAQRAAEEQEAAESAARAEQTRLDAEQVTADKAAADALAEKLTSGAALEGGAVAEMAGVADNKVPMAETVEAIEEKPINVENTNDFQQYLDEIASHQDYVGTRLAYMPESLKANESFMLKVAEYNPAEALSHASPELKGSKEFVMKLMKMQPSSDSNFQKVDFYVIERESPELSRDKDLAMELIDNNRYDTVPAQLLSDPEVFGLIKQKELQRIVTEAQGYVQRKQGGRMKGVDFKVRDNGQTLGGDRWSLLNDDAFAGEVKKALEPYGNVVIEKTKWQGDRAEMKFTPREMN